MSRLKDQHAAIWEGLKAKEREPILGIPQGIRRIGQPYRNKTEKAYAEQHLQPRLHAGEIRQWAYEAMKFRLGDGAYFTPDFMVWPPGDVVELHEVKGFMREAARVRFLVARDKFPMFHWKMLHRKNGAWVEMRI